MVRELVGSALLLSAVGSAAAFLSPSLFATPDGRPMIVSGAEVAGLHEARFDAADCFPAALLAGPAFGSLESSHSVVALTFGRSAGEVVVETDDVPQIGRSEQTLIVVIDESGRVLAAGPVGEWLLTEFGHTSSGACGASKDGKPGVI